MATGGTRMSGRAAIACAVGAALLAACGNGPQGVVDGSDERPCSEVEESLDEPKQILAETFGGGPEGREATATIVRTIQQRPDCFSDEEVALATDHAESLPSEEQREAIEAAEAACDERGGEFSRGSPGEAPYDSPEDVLASAEEPLPDGTAEPVYEGEGRVDFAFHDDAGDLQGWVMVEQADDGDWFLRRGITCGAEEPDP